jgi:hypothetical protein
VRLVSPLEPSRVFIDVAAGRGVFDLDKLGVSFRAGLTGTRAVGGNQRDSLVGKRHTHHDFKDPDALWRFLFEDIRLDNASLI